MTGMPDADFEAIYEELAQAIDRAGPEKEALFLTRLALLLAHRAGDAAAVRQAMAEALEDCATSALREPPPP